jgi:hypothetical protein
MNMLFSVTQWIYNKIVLCFIWLFNRKNRNNKSLFSPSFSQSLFLFSLNSPINRDKNFRNTNESLGFFHSIDNIISSIRKDNQFSNSPFMEEQHNIPFIPKISAFKINNDNFVVSNKLASNINKKVEKELMIHSVQKNNEPYNGINKEKIIKCPFCYYDIVLYTREYLVNCSNPFGCNGKNKFCKNCNYVFYNSVQNEIYEHFKHGSYLPLCMVLLEPKKYS